MDQLFDQWSWPRFNQMLLQLMDILRWFLMNMILRVGSMCLQALVHWCNFHTARDESEWCIITVMSRCSNNCCQNHCQAAGDFCFPANQACVGALSCCDTRLRTSHQTWPPNRPDLSSVNYRLLRVIQECVYQKQQGTSNIVDELWLLTEWHTIFHKLG